MFDPNKAPATLPELAHRTFTRFAARPYLGQKNKTSKSYAFQSYAQIAARVRDLSGAFLELDFERGTRIAILAENEANWAIIDLACQMCGLVVVPLFASLPAGQVETILADCRASAIRVGDGKHRLTRAGKRTRAPGIRSNPVREVLDNKRMEWETYRAQVHEYELNRYLSIL